jgi:uncharacterized protein (TIGR03000 family)
MYSVVMMIALSGGAQTPDWGWRWGCGGCCGGWTCSGCCGGCWGGWRGGCCGFFHRFHHWRCCGCCGGVVTCAGCVGCAGVMPGGVMPSASPGTPSKTFAPEVSSQNGETPHVFVNYQPRETSRPATVLVNLPADAKLTFNGWTSNNNSTTRRFRTPALEPGEEFAYTIRAELVRDGQTVVQNHRVVVRAGQETRVNIDFPAVLLSQNQE